MAITIDWDTKVITVPKADTQLIVAGPPQEIRQLDLDFFRLSLKDLEDDEEGIVFLRTHNHNPPLLVGGALLARVVELINGYTVTFENGAYAVNLVGANSNVADVTNVNQVSVRSANSAGLQDLSSLQAASFQGRVTYDADNGVAGTLFPIGTEGQPVNNLTDLFTIASERGIKRVQLFSDITLDRDIEDFTFLGATSKDSATFDFGGNTVTNCRFENLTMTGMGSGSFEAERSVLTSLAFVFVTGDLFSCGLENSILISTTGDVKAVDCYSEVAGTSTPFLEMGTTGTIQFRRYAGGIEIRSFEPGNTASFDLLPGHLVLDSSCTGGDMVVRGVGYITRNDSGAISIIDDGLATTQIALAAVESGLNTINEGVQNASLGIPHTTDLP